MTCFFYDVYQIIDELDLPEYLTLAPTQQCQKTKIYSGGINLFEKLMACNNPAIDLVNDNKYTRF